MGVELNSALYGTSAALGTTGTYGTTAAAPAEAEETAASTQNTKDTYQSSSKTKEDAGIYKPNTALVNQLKAEQEALQLRFLDNVRTMLTKQGKAVSGEGVWKVLASGDFTVDAATKKAAQDAISEDGYWGVNKTSERIVGFAKALVGGDPAQVEKMRDAFVKGYEAATKTWGKELPDITRKTYDAVMKLFDDWADESDS